MIVEINNSNNIFIFIMEMTAAQLSLRCEKVCAKKVTWQKADELQGAVMAAVKKAEYRRDRRASSI